MMTPFIKEKIEDLVRKGAVFWINHSGGQDSQAMFLALNYLVPRELPGAYYNRWLIQKIRK